MKYIKKYPELFENSEHQSSREDQLQVLADLLKTGLISQSEYTKLRLDIDPDQYATFHIELEFDWDWAAGHNSTEALDLLNGWLLSDQLFPENTLIGPVNIDAWVEGDHWEQADADDVGDVPNYDIRVFARFDLYYNRANNLEELHESLKGFLGRVFSSAECNGTDIDIDWPIEWPSPLDEAISIQDLSSRDERPMVDGIASILRKVRDVKNRREIAKAQIREFKRDGIRFDYAEFLELCEL